MRVGYLGPAGFGFGNRFSGAAALGRLSERAAREILGHETFLLSSWQQVSELRLDLIHAFTSSPSFIGGRPRSGVPWAVTAIHDSLMNPWLYRCAVMAGRAPRLMTEPALKSQLLREADVVITMSSNERDRIVDHFRIERSRIIVVNCPSPEIEKLDERVLDQVRVELDLPPVGFALAICDYGAKRKNIARLARAAIAAEIHLVLAGNASQTEHLEDILGLGSPFVTAKGPVSSVQKAALMQLASVYCQPSLEEGAGLAAMEAALHDCAVVASDVGGVREHIGSGAYWVEPTDIASIAAGLRRAHGEGSGDVGRFVRERRSFGAFAADTQTAYDQATSVGEPPSILGR